jgi:hypothetical protein
MSIAASAWVGKSLRIANMQTKSMSILASCSTQDALDSMAASKSEVFILISCHVGIEPILQSGFLNFHVAFLTKHKPSVVFHMNKGFLIPVYQELAFIAVQQALPFGFPHDSFPGVAVGMPTGFQQ